jgi:hypothetical protein
MAMESKSKARGTSVTFAVLGILGACALAAISSPAEAGKPAGPGKGKDRTPPAIVCPADITVAATGPAGAVVSFSASATDNTDPSPTITYSHAPGSTFPITTTTVTVTATDWKGNSSTCTFNVTVVEPENPFAGSYVGSWMYRDANGNYVGWYEWTLTVSEDGTVTGSGVQTSSWVWSHDGWNYVAPMPAGYSESGVVSGSISKYGFGDLAWSYSEVGGWDGEFDADGNPVYYEWSYDYSSTLYASLDGAGNLTLNDEYGSLMMVCVRQ